MKSMVFRTLRILATAFIFLISGSAYLQAQVHTPEKITGNNILMTRNGEQFFSHDGGISWEKLNGVQPKPIQYQQDNRIQINREDVKNSESRMNDVPMNRILLQRHSGEKFLSIDGGITWEKVQSGNNNNPSIPLPSIGEAVWEENIPVDSSVSSAPQSLTLLSDGGILINGGPVVVGYLMKVNSTGQRQWVRSYGHADSIIYVFSSVERASDTLQFIGLKRPSIIVPLAYPYSITTDHLGNIIASGQGTPLFTNGAQALIPVGTTGYVESGTINFGVLPDSTGNIFFRKVTLGGDVVWEEEYHRKNDLYVTPVMIVATADGGYAILVSHTNSARVQRPGIIRTDAEGKVIWRKDYDTLLGIPTAIVATQDNQFTFTGRITRDGLPEWTTSVVHVDEMGEISWNKQYGIGPVTLPAALVQAPDGGYLIGGFTAQFNARRKNAEDSTRDFYLLKIDSQGELIRQRTWGSPGIPESITELAVKGSNYIVAGYSNPYTSAPTLYLAEMEDVAASVRTSENPASQRYAFQIYPNPAAMSVETRLVLDSRSQVDLTLFDNLGNEVRSWNAGMLETGEQRVGLDIQGIASGLYVLRAVIGEHVLSQTLSIVR